MKKIYFLALAMLTVGSVNAQREISNVERVDVDLTTLTGERSQDTIVAPAIATGACSFVIYSSSSGYVAGTNNYSDLEKAQYFPTVGGDISGVLVLYGAKNDQGGNTNYNAKIYADGGGTPGTVLGTSSAVNISAVDTSAAGGWTAFPISPSVSASNGFFASVTVDGTDTVGIITTEDPCSNSLAWELWSDGTTWLPYNDGTSGWGLEIDNLMAVMIDNISLSTPEQGVSEVKTYYANNQIVIEGIVEGVAIDGIEVLDINGRSVTPYHTPYVSGGRYTFDVGSIATGNYIVVMNTNFGKVGTKVHVNNQ